MTHLQIVDDVMMFHKVSGAPILKEPTLPPAERATLRRSLMEEELRETLKAMDAGDLPEIADGLADLIYVVVGTALEYGINLTEVWGAVQEANMNKFPYCRTCGGEGFITPLDECPDCEGAGVEVVRREDGKILKPEGWKPADIAEVLKNQSPLR